MKKVLFLSVLCMAFVQALIGQTHWTPVQGIQNNMTMSAVLYVDGEEQALNSIEIGAFCGEECRASALPYEIAGRQVYFLTIKGAANDVITFRLWNHQLNEELEYMCEQSYTFIVDDIVGEYPDWFQIHFTDPTSIVEQMVALEAGTNWFSTYLDITLDDLKAALVAAVAPNTTITIKNATQSVVYSRNHWNGTLDWDVAKRYNIKVASACELTLEGMPIDPSEHPVTVVGSGMATWIGFPLGESMSLTNAFAGFAQNGDVIKSQYGNATYTRGHWNGEFSLEPGKGYLYISAPTATDRVLVYPASAK